MTNANADQGSYWADDSKAESLGQSIMVSEYNGEHARLLLETQTDGLF